ncbi:MAG: hypothetical protein CMG71_01635 [Candidatus Marinimicrobia bacterium]|nr:hypothetical protein [Candidatus Neomarinimicrobiota bacterium]|tara:strand:+ start:3282 stop:3776 length:495 start_codon:yes stop_codon:yes gene_type:complete
MIRYVVDGHNTIHSIPLYLELLDRDYPSCLKRLINDCTDYCSSHSVKIVIIFDGNPPFDPPKGGGSVSVFFSGKERDADALIVEKAVPPKSTTVVTNDGAVKRMTGSEGCRQMTPGVFFQLIASPVQLDSRRNNEGRKRRGLTGQEVSWWKREMEKELKKKRKQ